MKEEICHAHSGIATDLEVVKMDLRDTKHTVNSMISKLNCILGGLVVSLILLVVNLVIGK